MNNLSSLLVAQITDTHLFAEVEPKVFGVATHNSLQAVIERLRALQSPPDILLLTGDISQDESRQSYDRLYNFIAPLNIPTYWLPGNHDNLPIMEQVLQQSPIDATKAFQSGGWNFVLLSSLIPGCVQGEISKQSLDWLESQLKKCTLPTLVAIHHPPCLINSEWMDNINLRNYQEFLALIDHYLQIKLVIFGHIHQEFDSQRQGVRYLGSPSTCVQFQPQSKEFTIDKQAQPGFRLINLFSDGTYDTEVVRAHGA
ncbi:3',5'-cyclic-AMP phosphodiesterase [Synechocystis sp. PCC 7509]|uniref:3',5'-cyclic-AMP phosphodiesterase n=1 Tax=Synechocystis sp. PCC 7509 TaxID=927677 RepID=UPI0002AC7D3B|nr:3',5'-cyclic-AMP phosphodiesterase [Synechocystis sp. PCC 7509]